MQTPGQVQQSSEEGSREGLEGCGADAGSCSTGFQGRFQRRIRRRSGRLWSGRPLLFNKVPEKFPEKVPQKNAGPGLGGFGRADARSGSTGFGGRFRRRFRRSFGKLWCRNIPSGGKPRQRFERFSKKCCFRHSETIDVQFKFV